MNQRHGSDMCGLKVLVGGAEAVNNEILIGSRILRWSMYYWLLDDIHTDHGTGVRVAKGNGDGDVLISHWDGETMCDDRLHGERSGGEGGKSVGVRIGR